MKNVLVTGGCGFIGSHFINYFLTKYRNIFIVNIDAMYYSACSKNIKLSNDKNYKLIKGNICSDKLITKTLIKYNIDTVVHFAAQSHVDTSFYTPLQFTKDNVVGTHTLIECCNKYNKLKLFVHMSTDEVYGESTSITDIKNENSILCPTNPYSGTKAASEMILNSYKYSYNMPIIIVRCNNVYGPNQYHEKLIPKFIKLLRENKKCTVHGTGGSFRSFVYVDDVLRAIDLIIQKGKIGIVYNIGSDEEFSVIEVTKKIIKKVKKTDNFNTYIEYVDDRNFNDYRYLMSYDKLRNLGWTQITSFDEGLNKIITPLLI